VGSWGKFGRRNGVDLAKVCWENPPGHALADNTIHDEWNASQRSMPAPGALPFGGAVMVGAGIACYTTKWSRGERKKTEKALLKYEERAADRKTGLTAHVLRCEARTGKGGR